MRRPLALGLALCVALFVVLEVAAMVLYPGGTWWEPTAHGYRFFENYLCDLEWRVALDGLPNRLGSILAQVAMLVFVAAFVPFWILASSRRIVHAFGLASVVGIVAVTLMSSERFGPLHGAAVMFAAATGLAAAVLTTVDQLRSAHPKPMGRGAGWLGVSVLVSASVDLAMYVHTFAAGGPGSRAIPAVQKIALVVLLAWMSLVALRETPR